VLAHWVGGALVQGQLVLWLAGLLVQGPLQQLACMM
jgi:hypothetical protein